MRIGIVGLSNVVDSVQAAIAAVAKSPEFSADRDSGYFTILRKSDGRILLIVEVGNCKEEKTEKYFVFSQEKAHRLFLNNLSFGHVSSWQSRMEEEDKYGGAIVAGDFILSFSGLPELADEAVMMITAVLCSWATKKEMDNIATISTNTFWGYGIRDIKGLPLLDW